MGRGVTKRWSYLISLFSKNDDEGVRGGKKSLKIDDVFYERPVDCWEIDKALTFTSSAPDAETDNTIDHFVKQSHI